MNTVLILGLGAALLLIPVIIPLLAASREWCCPICRGETITVRTSVTRLLRRLLVLRWCMRCGWEGYARAKPPHTACYTIDTLPEASGGQRPHARRGT